MTTRSITCERFAERLADFLEREVDESTRAQIELHALGCVPCGALLADLRALRIDAANLTELSPSRDLWAGIAERIETPVVMLAPGGQVAGEAPRQRHRRGLEHRFMALWIGAAAATLVVTTAVITHQISTRSVVVATVRPLVPAVTPSDTPAHSLAAVPVATGASGVAARGGTPVPTPNLGAGQSRKATTTLASNRPSAEQTYDAEITRLRAIVAQRRPTLDTATVHVIEHNLKVIDDAITQCKQALQKDPASRFLMESLNDAFDTKIQLLRTAALLPART
jgi:Putative zinc-finger